MDMRSASKSAGADMPTVGGALVGGAGLAAIAALVNEYRNAKSEEKREKARNSPDDSDTIYLNIRGRKRKADADDEKRGESVPNDADLHSRTFSHVRRESETEESRNMHDEGAMRFRDLMGRFSGSDGGCGKSASAFVNTVSVLAGLDQLADVKNKQLEKKLDEKPRPRPAKGSDDDADADGDGPKIEVSDSEARDYVMKHRDEILRAVSRKPMRKKSSQDASIGDRISTIALGTAAAAGGFYLVSKIAREMEKRRLKRQLDAVRNEYVSAVVGDPEKMAEYPCMSSVLMVPCGGMDKSAGFFGDLFSLPGRAANGFKDTMALTGAGYIGTALLAAYLTKKVLDYKLGNGGSGEDEEPEKVRRIVFRTVDNGGDGAIGKKASVRDIEVDPETMLATVCMYMKIAECLSYRDMEKDAWFDEAKARRAREYAHDDAARRYIMEQFARGQGWIGDGYSYSDAPDSTLGGMFKDGWKGSSNSPASQAFMEELRANPQLMLQTLGENEALRRNMIAANFNNAVPGWLSWIPGIENLYNWFANNTQWGRKMVADQALRAIGMDPGSRAAYFNANGKHFGNGGWGYNSDVPKALPDVSGDNGVANSDVDAVVTRNGRKGRIYGGRGGKQRYFVSPNEDGSQTVQTDQFEKLDPELAWYDIPGQIKGIRGHNRMLEIQREYRDYVNKYGGSDPIRRKDAARAFWNSDVGRRATRDMSEYGIRYTGPRPGTGGHPRGSGLDDGSVAPRTPTPPSDSSRPALAATAPAAASAAVPQANVAWTVPSEPDSNPQTVTGFQEGAVPSRRPAPVGSPPPLPR